MDRILIVDDEKAIRDILSEMLSVMGFEVVVASSGNEGLHLFLNDSFDLVLTDLKMPGIDGWTLALYIKEKSPKTPIVLITGEEKGGIMEKLEGSCVDSVMFKPFRLEDIQETVQNMLHTGYLQRTTSVSSKSRPSSKKMDLT
ncbi:Regulatory protein AtoC [subsurface metagenome]